MEYLVCDVIDNKTEGIRFRCMLNVAVPMLEEYCPTKTIDEQADYLIRKTKEKMRSRKVASHNTTLKLKLHSYKYITKSNIKCYLIVPLNFTRHSSINTPKLKDYDTI